MPLEPAAIESAHLKPRSRRWFRFSLRTLLILFAVVAALLHFWIIPSERQRKTFDKIVAEGGLCNLAGLRFQDGTIDGFPDPFNTSYTIPINIEWYHHYFYHADQALIKANCSMIDWAAFPKLRTLIIDGQLDVDCLIKNKSLPKNLVQLAIHNWEALNEEAIDTLLHYKNLEHFETNSILFVSDEKKLLQFLDFPKLEKLDVDVVVLKPGYVARSSTNEILDKIRKEKPVFKIRVDYLKISGPSRNR